MSKNAGSLLKRPKIDIILGEPFHLELRDGRGRAAATATETIMRRIAELLPPEMRGTYADQPLAPVGPVGRA